MLGSRKDSGHDFHHSSTMMRESANISEQHNYQDFHNFLETSPYSQVRKRMVKPSQDSNDPSGEKVFNKDLDQYLSYFEVRKKELNIPSEPQEDLQDMNVPVSPIKMIDESPMHHFMMETGMMKADEVKTDGSPMHRISTRPGQSEMGSPTNSAMVDKNMKKLMETMQAKMIKLEQENRKLKRDVAELTSQNKKFQNQISSFITEQENFNKTKDTYEKRVKKLQDYCKSSDDTMSALKRILSLQEDELYEIIGRKTTVQIAPQRMSSVQDTKRTLKKTGTKEFAGSPDTASALDTPNGGSKIYNFLAPNGPTLSKNNSISGPPALSKTNSMISDSGSKARTPQKAKG